MEMLHRHQLRSAAAQRALLRQNILFFFFQIVLAFLDKLNICCQNQVNITAEQGLVEDLDWQLEENGNRKRCEKATGTIAPRLWRDLGPQPIIGVRK